MICMIPKVDLGVEEMGFIRFSKLITRRGWGVFALRYKFNKFALFCQATRPILGILVFIYMYSP